MLRRVALAFICAAATIGCGRPSTAANPVVRLKFAERDSVITDTVAPGILHYRVKRPSGPFSIQVVTIPLGTRYELLGSRAHDSLRSREKVSDMVKRHMDRGERIRVAMNADFFDLKTGANENNQVIDGLIWKANPVTDSPFDTFRSSHTQFAVGANGKPYLDRFSYAGTLDGGSCGHFVLDGVNSVPRVPDALILFTHAYADAPRRDSIHAPKELDVTTPRSTSPGIGSTELTPAGPVGDAPASIAPGHAVLAAYGSTSARLDSMARCTKAVRVTHAFRPDRGRLTTIVGGWPRVVADGRNIGGIADSLEGTFPRFSAERHPRSAVGFSRDSTTLYLVAVDGRQESSDGMSLTELGDFLVSIGVYQGLNFDGGGSTALVLNGTLVNHPSDAAGERTVGNAILVRDISR
jgi:hypothetical protein